MARYYDLDSLRVSDINVGTVMFPRMERCILLKDVESAPAADVVPKSEVDAQYDDLTICLEAECKVCGEKTTKVIADLQEKLSNAKAEVAREIFEDIENIMQILILDYKKYSACQSADTVWYATDYLLAELRKKYIGENDNE